MKKKASAAKRKAAVKKPLPKSLSLNSNSGERGDKRWKQGFTITLLDGIMQYASKDMKEAGSIIIKDTPIVIRRSPDGRALLTVQNDLGDVRWWVECNDDQDAKTLVQACAKQGAVTIQPPMQGVLLVKRGLMNKQVERFMVLSDEGIDYYKTPFGSKREGQFKIGVNYHLYLRQSVAGHLPKLTLAETGDDGDPSQELYAKTQEEQHAWGDAIQAIIDNKAVKKNEGSHKEGYLLGGTSLKGQKRLFVMLDEQGVSCYKKRKDTEPVVSVNLADGAGVVERVQAAPKKTTTKDEEEKLLGLRVATSGDESDAGYFFTAGNLEESDEWFKEIQRLLTTKSSLVDDSSVKEGYLGWSNKQGGFKTRFCILREDSLSCYKKRRDPVAEREVLMAGGSVMQPLSELTLLVSPSEDEGEKGRYYAQAKNEEEFDAWHKAIGDLLATKSDKESESSVKEGYLLVGWKENKLSKRYVILENERLDFFVGRRDKTAAGTVPLPGGAVCSPLHDLTHAFKVGSSGDKNEKFLVLRAPDQMQQMEWMTTFIELAATKNSKMVEDSMREGYLEIQTGLLKTWTKRMFVLMEDKLLHFDSRSDKKEAGVIVLPDGFEVSKEETVSGKKFVLAVMPSGDDGAPKTCLSSGSKWDLNGWLKELKDLSHMKNTPVNPGSLKEGYLMVAHGAGKANKRYAVVLEDKLQLLRKRADDTPKLQVMFVAGGIIHAEDSKLIVAENEDADTVSVELTLPLESDEGLLDEWHSVIKNVLGSKATKRLSNSLKEGYLSCGRKQATDTHSKRYVILVDNKINIYKKRMDEKPEESFELDVTLLFEPKPSNSSIFSLRKYGGKAMYFGGLEVDIEDWIQSIGEVLDEMNRLLHPGSIHEGYLSGPGDNPLKLEHRCWFALFADRVNGYKNPQGTTEKVVFGFKSVAAFEELYIRLVINDDSILYFGAISRRERELWLGHLQDTLVLRDLKFGDSLQEGWLYCGKEQEERYCVLLSGCLEIYRERHDDKAMLQWDMRDVTFDYTQHGSIIQQQHQWLHGMGPLQLKNKGEELILTAKMNQQRDRWLFTLRAELGQLGKEAERKQAMADAKAQEEKAEKVRLRAEQQAKKVEERQRAKKQKEEEDAIRAEEEALKREEELEARREALEAKKKKKAEDKKKRQETEEKRKEEEEREAEEKAAQLLVEKEKKAQALKERKRKVEERRKKQLAEAEQKAKEKAEVDRLAKEKLAEEKKAKEAAAKAKRAKLLSARKKKEEEAKAAAEAEAALAAEKKAEDDARRKEELEAKKKLAAEKKAEREAKKAEEEERRKVGEEKRKEEGGAEAAVASVTVDDVIEEEEGDEDEKDSPKKSPTKTATKTVKTTTARKSPSNKRSPSTAGTQSRTASRTSRTSTATSKTHARAPSKSSTLGRPKAQATKSAPKKGLSTAKCTVPIPTAGGTCELCEDAKATIWCPDCKMKLCGSEGQNCDEEMHMTTSRKKHVRCALAKEAEKKFSKEVVCYCCGRKFTYASLPIHLGSCPVQRKIEYRELPKELRPPYPSPPELPIPTENSTKAEFAAYNKEANAINIAHMPKCPYEGCGRSFLPSGIQKHMRGCRFRPGRF